ncbi:MAG: Hsp20/alpha crystallin family protein [Planctomycetota bacterium]|nr:MAG: Hsp20/alpha crystallin family protein [Planctomycetota bacterium]
MGDDWMIQPVGSGSGCWAPAADVYRTPQGWLVKFDLAGINPSELELERSGRHLVIRGVRRDVMVHAGLQTYSLEISYNRFERAVGLPCDIQSTSLSTEYRDGMLLVWLNDTSGRSGEE